MEWEHKLKQRLLIAYSENDTVYWQFKNAPLNTNNVFFSIDEKYVCEYVEKYGWSLIEFENTIIDIPRHDCFRDVYGEVLMLRNEPYKHCCVRRVDLCYNYTNRVFIEYITKGNSSKYGITGAEKVLPLTNEFAFDIMYFANFGESLLHKRNN